MIIFTVFLSSKQGTAHFGVLLKAQNAQKISLKGIRAQLKVFVQLKTNFFFKLSPQCEKTFGVSSFVNWS